MALDANFAKAACCDGKYYLADMCVQSLITCIRSSTLARHNMQIYLWLVLGLDRLAVYVQNIL